VKAVVIFIAALVAGLPGLGWADITTRLVLRGEVVVHGDQLRLMDLSATTLDPDLGHIVLCAAPAPGHTRTFDHADLLREMLRAGVRPIPTLAGAEQVEVKRPGQSLERDHFAARVQSALRDVPLPMDAVDQRFELHAVPDLRIGAGSWSVRLDSDPPRVGRGNVTVEVVSEHGDRRRCFVSLTRELQVPSLRSVRAVDAGTPIASSAVHADTLWTKDQLVLDSRVPLAEDDGRWTLRRQIAGGHPILMRDVRPTPVVRRGELVNWIVIRGGIEVRVSARSRGDGAPGEWILVESPFDHRLRRVFVVGPNHVTDHPPAPVAALASAENERGDRP
jgi:hypothetical protein